MNRVRPSAEQVSMYLERWDSLDNYVLQPPFPGGLFDF
jgi:hypothetical protein